MWSFAHDVICLKSNNCDCYSQQKLHYFASNFSIYLYVFQQTKIVLSYFVNNTWVLVQLEEKMEN